jgi:hypothetical protein
MVLRRVGVLSVAKIAGVMYAAMGLVFGLFFSAIFSLIPFAGRTGDPSMPSWIAPMFGAGALIFMPIFYGVLGLVGGAIGALVYNLFAGLVGGIELELEPAARPVAAPGVGTATL